MTPSPLSATRRHLWMTRTTAHGLRARHVHHHHHHASFLNSSIKQVNCVGALVLLLSTRDSLRTKGQRPSKTCKGRRIRPTGPTPAKNRNLYRSTPLWCGQNSLVASAWGWLGAIKIGRPGPLEPHFHRLSMVATQSQIFRLTPTRIAKMGDPGSTLLY